MTKVTPAPMTPANPKPKPSMGLWRVEGVPHKGWICADMEDLGRERTICEMCERQEIRYVHHMEHPDYPSALRVGCICAEHMEEDYTTPKRRERELVKRQEQRLAWTQTEWRTYRLGNKCLTFKRHVFTVWKVRGGIFFWRVTGPQLQRESSGFFSESAAKQNILEFLSANKHLGL
jgi:hypothetical protein